MKKIKVAELVILTLLITILIGIIGYKSFFEKEKEPAVTKKPEPVQVAEPEPEPEPCRNKSWRRSRIHCA